MVSKVDTSTTVHLAPYHGTTNDACGDCPDPVLFLRKNSTQCTTQKSTCYGSFCTGIVINMTHVGMCFFIVIMRSRLRYKLRSFTRNSHLFIVPSYITRVLHSTWNIFFPILSPVAFFLLSITTPRPISCSGTTRKSRGGCYTNQQQCC